MEDFKEEWRPMVGFEGLYEVSNTGKVDSLNYHRERKRHPLKTWLDKDGYVFVIPYKDGEPHKTMLHRAVAMAFIPNPNNFPCINHKDENPKNNNVFNLEWCTHKYNANFGTRTKRIIEKKEKEVVQKNRNGEIIAIFNSLKEASNTTGIKREYINKACWSSSHISSGYVWEYKNVETIRRAKRKTKEEKERLKNKPRRIIIYDSSVIQYNKNGGDFIKEYQSIGEAFKETGINRRAIIENCRGTRNSTHGYIFKYKEDVK